jgi:thiol-disulfide isomerase/thioredoxin
VTRAPVDDIQAPGFPPRAAWINSRGVRMHEQRGHPVLVEFWDFCRPNSLRTLPYMAAWHERYHSAGLLVIGVHAAGFAPGASPGAVSDAVARLGIRYPVIVDAGFDVWRDYENLGWPARYLFGPGNTLDEYHYGEGAYAETETAIRSLLGLELDDGCLMAPVRPEDEPDAVRANGASVAVEHPGAYRLIAHPVSTAGELTLEVDDGVTCHGVCFTPGLAG